VFRAPQWRGPLERLATLDYDPAAMRANDGKCDALGRFWIGTIDETKTRRNAALYCLDGRASGTPLVQRKLGPDLLPATTANGLAWSPDGHTLYWADTPSHLVRAWDFDVASASLSAQRDFAQFPPKPTNWQVGDTTYRGRPDGAAVDIQGSYFVAMYEGQRICKFAANGTLLAEFRTPAQCPTMPCFGGEDLQTLFVTTARHGRSAAELATYPDSGCVFSMRLDMPGLPVNLYAD
jgi:sugar lactone lactonase YvrE